MIERLNSIVFDTLGMLFFCLMVGGVFVLPVLGAWVILVWKLMYSRYFYWAWVPFMVVIQVLLAMLAVHVHSVWVADGSSGGAGAGADGGGVSYELLPLVAMLFTSSIISPVLLLAALRALAQRGRPRRIIRRRPSNRISKPPAQPAPPRTPE